MPTRENTLLLRVDPVFTRYGAPSHSLAIEHLLLEQGRCQPIERLPIPVEHNHYPRQRRLNPGIDTSGQIRLCIEYSCRVRVVTNLEQPNGLALSRDEETLDMVDSGVQPAKLMAYSFDRSAKPASSRVFAECPNGMYDGVRIDPAGDVWTSAGDGVDCLGPNGALIGKLAGATNAKTAPILWRRLQICFGCIWLRGQDLNLRPSGYEPDELPGCSTPRYQRKSRRDLSRQSKLLSLRLYPIFAEGKISMRPHGRLCRFLLQQNTVGLFRILQSKRTACVAALCDRQGRLCGEKIEVFALQNRTTLPLADLAATYSPAS